MTSIKYEVRAVATITGNKTDIRRWRKIFRFYSQTLRSELPSGFGAPGKLSGGQFSAENGRQPRRVTTIKFADNKADDRQWRKFRQRHSQPKRSDLPSGFGAPGKLSGGQFSAENGRQPRRVATIEVAEMTFFDGVPNVLFYKV